MAKDFFSYIKENSSPKKRVLFPLPTVVDIMLQIARGMEFLHSRKIYVGDFNPSNVLLKPRKATEGYFHVKVSGFGLTSVKKHSSRHSSPEPSPIDTCIWHAPEVLAEQGQARNSSSRKFTEKADVYSFGMICFQLLTGKLPFEDGHLQGDQMINNIRAGERPLFPSLSPKYLVNLTKKCWHTEPSYRPTFSSICRVLRYIKKFLVMNPNDGQPYIQSPPVDFYDLEAGFLKKFQGERKKKLVYTLNLRILKAVSEAASNGCDESNSVVEDRHVPAIDARSFTSDVKSFAPSPADKKLLLIKKTTAVKVRKVPGKPKPLTPSKSLPWTPPGHSMKMRCESPKPLSKSSMSPIRRRSPGQASNP
ncbi:hypothetical protein OIU78_013693 [Salix suchowensis]|nr:hypothetical protein OIU78_013693 [Salix suchowensis]